jgi:hypothetical protein
MLWHSRLSSSRHTQALAPVCGYWVKSSNGCAS